MVRAAVGTRAQCSTFERELCAGPFVGVIILIMSSTNGFNSSNGKTVRNLCFSVLTVGTLLMEDAVARLLVSRHEALPIEDNYPRKNQETEIFTG